MLLQPADFYSYSRATGTKPPENDQERAAMAVDVIDFKRNQLRAPSPEDNEGRDLSLIALGAGILGSIVGGRKIMKGFESRTPTPTKKVSFEQPAEIAKLNRRNNQKLQQDLSFVDEALKKVEKDAYPEYTKQELEALQGIDREVKGLREVKPSKIVESPTTVENVPVEIKGDIGKIVQTGKPSSLTADDIAEMNRRSQVQSQVKATPTDTGDLGAFAKLQNSLPKADFDTRVIAYVNSGDKKFLDINYSPRTVGLNQYLEDFAAADSPLIQPKFNPDGTVKSAVYKPIELGIEQGGEPRRGIGGVDKPVTIESDEIVDKPALAVDPLEEGYMAGTSPMTKETATEVTQLEKQGLNVLETASVTKGKKTDLIGTEGFVQTEQVVQDGKMVGMVESEQSVARRNEFAQLWDQQLGVEGSGVKKPRFELRTVTLEDLKVPVKQGDKIITYEDKLSITDPEKLQLIKQGENVELAVPFQVNKAKAIRDLQGTGDVTTGTKRMLNTKTGKFETITVTEKPNIRVLEQNVRDYKQTGRALAPLAQNTIAKVSRVQVERVGKKPVIEKASTLKPDLIEDERRFEQVLNQSRAQDLQGDITPEYMTRARTPGGTTESLLSEDLYNLKYKDDGGYQKIYAADNSQVNDFTKLSKRDKLPIKVSVSEQEGFITMQPMGIDKVEGVPDPSNPNRNLLIDRPTKSGNVIKDVELVKVFTTTVNAPLQILDTKTNKPKVQSTVITDNTGKKRIVTNPVRLPRPMMEGIVNEAKAEFLKQDKKGNYLRSTVSNNRLYPKSYEVAEVVDDILQSRYQIKLPVLKSYSSGDFIDSIAGRASSYPQKFRYATRGSEGETYSFSTEDLQNIKTRYGLPKDRELKSGKILKADVDTTLSRDYSDVDLKDIREKPSGLLEVEQRDSEGRLVTEFDESFEYKGARELGSPTTREMNRPSKEQIKQNKARRLLEQQKNILLGIEEDPAKVKSEIKAARQAERKEREARRSTQTATSNLYQQLKRRSGKKKGGR